MADGITFKDLSNNPTGLAAFSKVKRISSQAKMGISCFISTLQNF